MIKMIIPKLYSVDVQEAKTTLPEQADLRNQSYLNCLNRNPKVTRKVRVAPSLSHFLPRKKKTHSLSS